MSYEAALADHYAGIRARFGAAKEPEAAPRVRHVSLRVRSYSDLISVAPQPVHAPVIPIVRTPKEVTSAIVQDILNLASASEEDFIPRTEWKDIAREVATKHNVSVGEIKGNRRSTYLVEARHELFYRLAHETTMSLPEIGRRVGGKDHTTVLHGIRRHAERHGLDARRGGGVRQ